MKKTLILSILCFTVLFMPKANGWMTFWLNDLQVFMSDGVMPIQPGALVQLIYDGGNGVVDDPIDWIKAQADPVVALQAWIAHGCLPVGDDQLVVQTGPAVDGTNPTYIIDCGDPDPYVNGGYYGSLITNITPGVGGLIYTRFFTTEHPMECDWYGVSGVEETGQAFQFYQVMSPDFNFFTDHGGIADTHISILEPSSVSMLLGGIGILLSLLRDKK